MLPPICPHFLGQLCWSVAGPAWSRRCRRKVTRRERRLATPSGFRQQRNSLAVCRLGPFCCTLTRNRGREGRRERGFPTGNEAPAEQESRPTTSDKVDELAEPGNRSCKGLAFQCRQKFLRCLGRILQALALPLDHGADRARSLVDQVNEEVVGML